LLPLLNKPDEAMRNYQESVEVQAAWLEAITSRQPVGDGHVAEFRWGKPDAAMSSYTQALQLLQDSA